MNIAVRTRESSKRAANAGEVALIAPGENHPVAAALDDIADFAECCEVHAWYHAEGWISLQTAVDNLQALAERWGLPGLHGQDEIQRIMAYAPPAGIGVGKDAIRRARGADAPPERIGQDGKSYSLRQRVYHPPQSTIDAFWYVVRLDDAEYLKRWLAQHPRDAEALCKLWEGKNAAAKA
jgi:hypothetical protein